MRDVDLDPELEVFAIGANRLGHEVGDEVAAPDLHLDVDEFEPARRLQFELNTGIGGYGGRQEHLPGLEQFGLGPQVSVCLGTAAALPAGVVAEEPQPFLARAPMYRRPAERADQRRSRLLKLVDPDQASVRPLCVDELNALLAIVGVIDMAERGDPQRRGLSGRGSLCVQSRLSGFVHSQLDLSSRQFGT